MNQTIKLQVGVKVFSYNSEGQILLIKRNLAKYPTVNNPWDIVGGRIDSGSDLLTNLNREVREEAGLEIGDAILLTAQDIIKPEIHVVRLTYISPVRLATQLEAGKCVTTTQVTLSDEHTEYKWLNPEEILETEGLDSYVKAILKDNRLMSFIKDTVKSDRK